MKLVVALTIQVPIPEDLLPVLDRKAKEAGVAREQFVQNVLTRELSPRHTLEEILGPFREDVAASGMTDDELNALFTEARNDASRSR